MCTFVKNQRPPNRIGHEFFVTDTTRITTTSYYCASYDLAYYAVLFFDDVECTTDCFCFSPSKHPSFGDEEIGHQTELKTRIANGFNTKLKMREDSGLGLSFGTAGAIAQASAIEPERNETDQVWEEEEEEELPVISIELERLVGFKPSTNEEIDAIKKQLIEAMWMRYKSTSGLESKEDETTTTTEEAEEDETSEPPPDFDDQIKELLDSRVARFGFTHSESDQQAEESTDKTNPGPFLEITYPSRVLPPNATNETSNALQDTAKLWRDIRGLSYALDEEEEESETHAFWYRLADHLEHTGRLLSWKHGMALELNDILAREMLHKNHELWIQEQRTAKLEQLYQVRETLVHRKEVAQEDFQKLELSKDTAIRRDMLLYDHTQKRNQRNGGNSSLFGGTDLNFPEEFELMGLMPKDSQLYEEEDWGGTLDDDDDFDYYQSDYSDGYSDDEDDGDLSGFSGDEECERDDHNDDDDEPRTINTLANGEGDDENPSPPPNTMLASPDIVDETTMATTSVPRPFLRRNKARRKKKARAQKKRELAEAAKKEAAHKRKEHEILANQKHTSNELVLAQTLLKALDQKVQDVEELLENLQEEEWAAQEEQETEKQEKNVVDNNQSDDLSLLDQVLAMILGGLPMEPGNKDKQAHFQFVKDEHEFIVTGWKDYFGRLPQKYIPGTSSEEQEQDETSLSETKPTPKTHTAVGWKAPSLNAASHKLTTISRKKSAPAANNINTTVTPQEQRIALGIVDNEDGDWEDDDE